ncbi:MAG: hypothetical protein SNI70_03775 [Rikenellaceae bacterium]
MKLKPMIPYLMVNIMAFYLLPIVIKDTGSAMAVMLLGIPLICLLTAIIYGVKNSFNFMYPIIVAILFAPTISIFYNSTASVYIIGYGVIALIGNFVGALFYKMKQHSL